jgi:hypothetical protein
LMAVQPQASRRTKSDVSYGFRKPTSNRNVATSVKCPNSDIRSSNPDCNFADEAFRAPIEADFASVLVLD